MSMSDTAEYWFDVKSRQPYYGPDYYHVPNFECGHRHLFEAKYIDQVNCKDCKKALLAGIEHTLKSAELHKKEDEDRAKGAIEKNKNRWRKKYPNNPVCSCGFVMIARKNQSTGKEFYGCSQFPFCKNTKLI